MRILACNHYTALVFAAIAASPAAATLPEPAQMMIETALASEDDAEIAIILKYAQKIWPEQAQELENRVAFWRAEKIARTISMPMVPAQQQQASADGATEEPVKAPPIPWKGKGELGGYWAQGNSDYFGVNAGVALRHDGHIWRHNVKAQADYQENEGKASRQRFVFSYQPNYRVDDRTYVYGLTQYEHDRFLGYDSRYSLSTGVGYRSKDGLPISLELEAGPAYRFTNFTDGGSESTPAARGSVNLEWKLGPTLTFAQNAAAYLDGLNNTLNTTSALNAKLFGPLSARLSYNVQYESAPPDGKETKDTMSRISLVYDF